VVWCGTWQLCDPSLVVNSM